jgi:hypothetical protein
MAALIATKLADACLCSPVDPELDNYDEPLPAKASPSVHQRTKTAATHKCRASRNRLHHRAAAVGATRKAWLTHPVEQATGLTPGCGRGEELLAAPRGRVDAIAEEPESHPSGKVREGTLNSTGRWILTLSGAVVPRE